jgi:hypothetical protein
MSWADIHDALAGAERARALMKRPFAIFFVRPNSRVSEESGGAFSLFLSAETPPYARRL